MPTSVFFVNEGMLNGTAPYTYLLDSNPSPNGNMFYTSTLNPGLHTVTVQDANGCTGSGTFVSEAQLPTISATSTNPSCTELGSITLAASGGVPPYFYSIDGGVHFTLGSRFTDLSAGTYESKVKDAHGNTSSTTAVITEPEPLTATISQTKYLENQTVITVSVIGGYSPYFYSINGGPFQSSNAYILGAYGNVDISVKDSNNCTLDIMVTRLAVTTKLSLSTADFVLPNFKFYPNSVKNSLTISNTATIDEVVLISVKGEIILTKQINSTDAKIDLSAFSKGLYFLKVKAEGTEKTIKIIKE